MSNGIDDGDNERIELRKRVLEQSFFSIYSVSVYIDRSKVNVSTYIHRGIVLATALLPSSRFKTRESSRARE